jgi:dipeptidyl aminopeptidase/acylaminoacyl peptidase
VNCTQICKKWRDLRPSYLIADLRALILVAHGKQERPAPFVHAKRLRKTPKKHGKEYEWFLKNREAHGFYNNENQVEYLQTAIKFLNKHLWNKLQVQLISCPQHLQVVVTRSAISI